MIDYPSGNAWKSMETRGLLPENYDQRYQRDSKRDPKHPNRSNRVDCRRQSCTAVMFNNLSTWGEADREEQRDKPLAACEKGALTGVL